MFSAKLFQVAMIAGLLLVAPACADGVPGVVMAHVSPPSGIYVGSPWY